MQIGYNRAARIIDMMEEKGIVKAKQIMLVNEKFFKKIFSISIVLLISTNLAANEKDRIIAGLNSLNSLEFTFNQLINEKKKKELVYYNFQEN